jgi:hypothetical protein
LARARGPALLALALVAAGCGGGGASAGATVSVYAAAPLCREARDTVKGAGAETADLEVRVVCLPAVKAGGGVDLAATGRDARRATEDSTAVAYLESPGPGAKFAQPIVEAAGVAWLETGSGSRAMHRVLRALAGDEGSPREAVLDEVG